MKKSKQNKTTVQSKHLWQKYPELFILLGIVLILVLLTKGIVWYQTEQHAQTIRKDRERFEAVEADMQALIQQLPKIEKPGTNWQINKGCSQASQKFEPNPDKSCYVLLGSTILLGGAEDATRLVDQYNSVFISQGSFIYKPTTAPMYPNLSKGISVPTSRLFTDFNILNAAGKGGGIFTHKATSIKCSVEYNVQVSEAEQSFLNTSLACDDTSNALHF